MPNRLTEDWISFASLLADTAGEIARMHFRAGGQVEIKGDASPVTRADREIESALRAGIMERFPGHGIYGEEEKRHNESASVQWVIDPIDGTRAFIAGYPLFTTLIALAIDGVPLLGIIDQPVLRERWVGIKGKPTQLNGAPVKTYPCSLLPEARLATTSLPYFTPAQKQAFEGVSMGVQNIVCNGDAYAYAMLASGHLDLVIDAALKPYDYAALVPVVEGAGGVIADWHGKPLSLDSNGAVVAASSPALHRSALKALGA